VTDLGSHLKVGILRMCDFSDVLSAVHGPYLRLFEMMFAGRPVELVDIAVHEGETPGALSDADVWIASGSPASVYDDHEWIASAEDIVRDAAASETPFVGICFGHQLVAQALGGRVERADVGWGVGALEYTTVVRPRALVDLPDTLTILASHQDQVVDVPDSATVWSTSEYCPNAGLVVGERMWTVQGHPEFTPDLVRALYPSRRDRVGDGAVDAALATLDRPLSNRLIADAIVTTG
jgi:GMP synthase-like glutamine amidotransferase